MTAFKFTILVAISLFCLNCNLLAQADTNRSKSLVGDSATLRLLSVLDINIENELNNFSYSNKADTKLHAQHVFDRFKDSGNYYSDLQKNNSKPTRLIVPDKGYLNYQWIHRSGLDTPFIETNSSQHLLHASFSIVMAEKIPVRISYFERHSNSKIFQDFRDFRVEFNAQSFSDMNRLQTRKKLSEYENKLRKPFLNMTLDKADDMLNKIKSTLDATVIKNKFIDCKEILLSPGILDTLKSNKKDSILSSAKDFVALYEKVNAKKDSLQHFYDSLKNEFIQCEKNIRRLQLLVNGRINPSEIIDTKDSLALAGLSGKDLKSILEPSSPIRTFALGRTLPNFSQLTVKNTNVKGLNFEFNKDNLYFAAVAGKVDLHDRDFVYRGSVRPRQYVYSFRIGYGKKESSHLIATYYAGQKQISFRSAGSTSLIRGTSIAGQLLLSRNTRASIEFAQSFAPYIHDSSFKSVSKIFNRNNQAVNVGFRSFLPATKTRLEANYTRQGINFQNFTGYRINGASDSWYVKAEQDVFKRNVHITGSVRKNDLSNPFVLRRYNANTIVGNISASLRKRNFPTITVALMPSSQYTLVDSEVYEYQYQSFTGSVFHIYNIGTSKSTSSLVITRLNNSSTDSGFIYYNANNVLFNQSLDFSSFIVNSGFSYTANSVFKITVLQASISHKLFRESAINYGLKLNRLNNDTDLKFGFFGNAKINISKIGELNINIEKSYLPNEINMLSNYQFFTIGFSRYFN